MRITCKQYPALTGVLPKQALGLDDTGKAIKPSFENVTRADFVKGMATAAAGADVRIEDIKVRLTEGLSDTKSINIDYAEVMKLDCLHRDLVCTGTYQTMLDLVVDYWEPLDPESFVRGWRTAMCIIHGAVTPA